MNIVGDRSHRTVVLYHAQCQDGFAAAYAAWTVLGDDAQYLPVSYDKPLPPEAESASGIYLVDFSLPREQILALRTAGKQVIVIDHHRTAREALTGLDDCVFDMEHSGCVLTWRHFHVTPVPDLLLHVEDRDLWRFALPGSREVFSALEVVERAFPAWHTLVADPGAVPRLVAEGRVLLKYERRQVDAVLRHRHWTEIGGVRCLAVNSPVLASEIGGRLATLSQEEGGTPMAVVYSIDGDGTRASLRSLGDFDVAAIARRYGGGGHRNAAGCRLAGCPPVLR